MMMFPSAGIFDCAIAKLPGEGSDEFLHVDIPGLQVVSGRYDPNRPIGSLSNNTVLHSGKFRVIQYCIRVNLVARAKLEP